MKKRMAIVLMLVIVISAFFSMPAAAASGKVSKTGYHKLIKTKKYIYCADGYSIYRVNCKTKSVKRLVTDENHIYNMQIHKGYIYYGTYPMGPELCLYRVKTTGKHHKSIGYCHIINGRKFNGYVVKGSHIYYKNWKGKIIRANLEGKKGKAVKIKLVNNTKKMNTEGYKIIIRESDDFYADYDMCGNKYHTGYMVSYLRFPNGEKIRLGKTDAKDITIL